MNTQNYHNWNNMQNGMASMNVESTATKTFMTQVFGWMSGALIITALTSYLFAMVPELTAMLYQSFEGRIVGLTGLGWIAMLSPFAFVLLISFGFNRLSFPVLVAAFLAYAAVTGMSLSTIFFRYDLGSIGLTFIVTAGMFGVMAVMGFITKADLSGFGRIMFMGMIGIIIASLVNFFMHSEALDYIISFAGVAIFTGLTAWDVQKLKNVGAQAGDGTTAAKLSIMGALTLYLDFINLFLFLLRLMGNRK